MEKFEFRRGIGFEGCLNMEVIWVLLKFMGFFVRCRNILLGVGEYEGLGVDLSLVGGLR